MAEKGLTSSSQNSLKTCLQMPQGEMGEFTSLCAVCC